MNEYEVRLYPSGRFALVMVREDGLSPVVEFFRDAGAAERAAYLLNTAAREAEEDARGEA